MKVELKSLDTITISVLLIAPAMQAHTEQLKSRRFLLELSSWYKMQTQGPYIHPQADAKGHQLLEYLAQLPPLMSHALRSRLVICVLSLLFVLVYTASIKT